MCPERRTYLRNHLASRLGQLVPHSIALAVGIGPVMATGLRPMGEIVGALLKLLKKEGEPFGYEGERLS